MLKWLLCRLYNYHWIYGLQNHLTTSSEQFTVYSAQCTLSCKLWAWFSSPSFLFHRSNRNWNRHWNPEHPNACVECVSFYSVSSMFSNTVYVNVSLVYPPEISLANGIMKITHWKLLFMQIYHSPLDANWCLHWNVQHAKCEIQTIKSHFQWHQKHISKLLNWTPFEYHTKHYTNKVQWYNQPRIHNTWSFFEQFTVCHNSLNANSLLLNGICNSIEWEPLTILFKSRLHFIFYFFICILALCEKNEETLNERLEPILIAYQLAEIMILNTEYKHNIRTENW